MRDGEGMGMEPFTFAGKTLHGHTGGSASSGAWLAYYPGRETGPRLYDEREDLPGGQHRERRFRHLLESAVSDSRSTRSMSARMFWTDTLAFT